MTEVAAKTNGMRKPVVRTVVAAAIVCVFLLLFLPIWLSSSLGNAYLREQVFGHWNADVQVNSFDVGWNSPMIIQNVSATYEGQTILTIDSIQTVLTFPKLLTRDGGFERITVRGLDLLLENSDGVSTVEKMIPIDPTANTRIEIIGAKIDLRDANGLSVAKIRNAQLVMEIKKVNDEAVFIIGPTELLCREPMKLELREHFPAFLQFLFKTPYTDAIVTTRILEHVRKIEDENGLTSTTELVIHSLQLANPQLEAIASTLIREFGGLPNDCPDVAILHISRSGSNQSIQFVKQSSFRPISSDSTSVAGISVPSDAVISILGAAE